MTDAEGSFTLTIIKNRSLKTGYFLQPSFQINLHQRDLALLEKIKAFFGGVDTISKSGPNANMNDIIMLWRISAAAQVIIPQNFFSLKNLPTLNSKT